MPPKKKKNSASHPAKKQPKTGKEEEPVQVSAEGWFEMKRHDLAELLKSRADGDYHEDVDALLKAKVDGEIFSAATIETLEDDVKSAELQVVRAALRKLLIVREQLAKEYPPPGSGDENTEMKAVVAEVQCPLEDCQQQVASADLLDHLWECHAEATPELKGELSDEGKVVQVPLLSSAGLGLVQDKGTNDPVPLYMRAPAVKTAAMVGGDLREVVVSGLPGNGKSCLAFAATLKFAELHPDDWVLWLHVSRKGQAWMLFFHKRKFVAECGRSAVLVTNDRLPPLRHKFKLAVVDGVTEETQGNYCSWIQEVALPLEDHGRVRYVGSSSLKLGAEDVDPNCKLEVLSWTLEEYKAACEAPEIWEFVKENLGSKAPAYGTAGACPEEKCPGDRCPCQDDGKAALLHRFDVAGHAARWFFLFDDAAALKDAKAWVSRCDDASKLLSGLQGANANQSTGHVLARLPDREEPSIVSRLVARLLARRAQSDFIKQAYRQSFNNAFAGWVLEMDVLQRMQNEMTLELTTTDGQQMVYEDLSCFMFAKLADVVEELQNARKGQRWCFIPHAPNQGCFDFFFLTEDKSDEKKMEAWFGQVTWSDTHSCKMWYVTEVLAALKCDWEVSSVHMGFVVRKAELANFKIPECARKKPTQHTRGGNASDAWSRVKTLSAAAHGFVTADKR